MKSKLKQDSEKNNNNNKIIKFGIKIETGIKIAIFGIKKKKLNEIKLSIFKHHGSLKPTCFQKQTFHIATI